jgi:molybdopterin/thiamine biosynthesis adenylyltransferase
MDFKRQLGLFNPGEYENTSVSLVGVGSIGSFAAIVLAKMGIRNLVLYDGDMIEEHNLPNQFFTKSQLGLRKADAMEYVLSEFTDADAECHGKVTEKTILFSDVVVACTDSMSSRKLVYRKSRKLASYLIDARMAGDTYRIYTVDLKDKEQRKYYEGTLYGDKEASEVPCTEKTIVYNVAEVAAKIGSQVRKLLKKEPYSRMLAGDFKNDILIKTR